MGGWTQNFIMSLLRPQKRDSCERRASSREVWRTHFIAWHDPCTGTVLTQHWCWGSARGARWKRIEKHFACANTGRGPNRQDSWEKMCKFRMQFRHLVWWCWFAGLLVTSKYLHFVMGNALVRHTWPEIPDATRTKSIVLVVLTGSEFNLKLIKIYQRPRHKQQIVFFFGCMQFRCTGETNWKNKSADHENQ